ncbi:hypothetical protein NST02_09795 [Robertmurraya sp. FSL W8-0741]|uniref:hypothetical protein n=1 Tax=Robertmurraya TaxID=2837507 RepID=UPI000BA79869|nr:hypothetical protein [Robertmurraya siralis]PAE22019.1 hypothetical protein CHH80_03325 [Bacillus sp. 7504-2]
MLKGCRGFFLAELFLSLTVWMLMCLTLLPLYLHVSKQSLDIQKEISATHLMYEVLQHYLQDGFMESGIIHRENESFRIHWETGLNSPIKVCIKYENSFAEEREKCERLE